MNRLKTHWAALSRPVRILLLWLMLLVAVFLTYIAIGSPPLTAEIGYRRAEKANMVGPGQILAEIDLNEPNKKGQTVIVAQSTNHDILYWHNSSALRAYPKNEKPSLYCISTTPPKSGVNGISEGYGVQLVLFDRNPQAVSAEIRISTTYFDTYIARDREVVILETADRMYDGFFYYSIQSFDGKQLSLLQYLKYLWDSYDTQNKDSVKVNVRLFDKDDKLLSNREILPGPSIS